jgi:hypothetical protein
MGFLDEFFVLAKILYRVIVFDEPFIDICSIFQDEDAKNPAELIVICSGFLSIDLLIGTRWKFFSSINLLFIISSNPYPQKKLLFGMHPKNGRCRK